MASYFHHGKHDWQPGGLTEPCCLLQSLRWWEQSRSPAPALTQRSDSEFFSVWGDRGNLDNCMIDSLVYFLHFSRQALFSETSLRNAQDCRSADTLKRTPAHWHTHIQSHQLFLERGRALLRECGRVRLDESTDSFLGLCLSATFTSESHGRSH